MLVAPALWPWSPAAAPADCDGDAAADAPAAAGAQSSEESGGGESGGGGRWPADPSSLLGRRVRRTFEGVRGVYYGVVRSTRLLLPEGPDDGPAQQVWGIDYTDGDAEELYWHEMLPYLVRLSDEKPAHAVPRTDAVRAAPRKRVRPRRPPPKYKWDAAHGGAGSGGGAAAAPAAAPARPHGAKPQLLGGVVVQLPPRAGEVHGSSQSAQAKAKDAHRRQGVPAQAHAADKSAARGKTHSAARAAPAPPRSSSAAAARSRGGPHAAAVDSPPPKLPAVKLETPPAPEREDTPCPSVDGGGPPAAQQPAPAAHQLRRAAAPDGAAAVQEFLRRVTPTINDLDRVVAAVPPRMTMAQLLRAVAKDTLPADREAAVHCMASILGIDDASDRLQLLIELQALARRNGS